MVRAAFECGGRAERRHRFGLRRLVAVGWRSASLAWKSGDESPRSKASGVAALPLGNLQLGNLRHGRLGSLRYDCGEAPPLGAAFGVQRLVVLECGAVI